MKLPSAPQPAGRNVALWLALLALIAAGIGLAWLGTSPLRGETTASGLRNPHRREGQRPLRPGDGTGCLVEYEGRTGNGTVFDDSARHGGPQPMIAGQVIPGFAEALTKMQKGGKYKIHIPGNLAYGANPPQGSPFGPNEALDFDVHIVQIVPNAALMTQRWRDPREQAPQPPQPEAVPNP